MRSTYFAMGAAGLLCVSCGDSSAQPSDAGVHEAPSSSSTFTDARPAITIALDGAPVNDFDLSPRCNGLASLCERPYDLATFAATHAAMASDPLVFDHTAQHFGIHRQLDDGIRGLVLEVHIHDTFAALCYGSCAEGHERLSTALAEIQDFLTVNPREVVNLFLEGDVPASTLGYEIVAAMLDRFAYVHDASTPFPQLGEMIATGKRLVMFADDAQDGPPWLNPTRDLVWATGSHFTRARDMECYAERGSASSPLMLVNQFLVTDGEGGAPVPGGSDASIDEARAREVNLNPFLLSHVKACQADGQRVANFVAVDFYDIGNVRDVTRLLNGAR